MTEQEWSKTQQICFLPGDAHFPPTFCIQSELAEKAAAIARMTEELDATVIDNKNKADQLEDAKNKLLQAQQALDTVSAGASMHQVTLQQENAREIMVLHLGASHRKENRRHHAAESALFSFYLAVLPSLAGQGTGYGGNQRPEIYFGCQG